MAKMNWSRTRIEARDARAPRKYKPLKYHKQPPKPTRSMPPPVPVPACPRCDSPMVRRTSEFGKFWGCSQYPACKGTRKVSGRK
jgi:hypothetical protein